MGAIKSQPTANMFHKKCIKLSVVHFFINIMNKCCKIIIRNTERISKSFNDISIFQYFNCFPARSSLVTQNPLVATSLINVFYGYVYRTQSIWVRTGKDCGLTNMTGLIHKCRTSYTVNTIQVAMMFFFQNVIGKKKEVKNLSMTQDCLEAHIIVCLMPEAQLPSILIYWIIFRQENKVKPEWYVLKLCPVCFVAA